MTDYAVFRRDDANNRLGKVGRVSIGDGNRMSILEVEAGAESDLRKAVDRVNGSDALFWKHPAGGESESGRSKIRKERIGRDDPRFIRAIQDNFQRWHLLELDLPPEPADEEDEDEDEEDAEE
jgi:hypothetical protein